MPQRRGAGQRGRGLLRAWVRVVAVAHPQPDRQTRGVGVIRRGEVAVRGEVASLVRGARLHRDRTMLTLRAVADLEDLGPDRVLLGDRVALEDVADEECSLSRDGPCRRRIGRVIDDLPGWVADLED